MIGKLEMQIAQSEVAPENLGISGVWCRTVLFQSSKLLLTPSENGIGPQLRNSEIIRDISDMNGG